MTRFSCPELREIGMRTRNGWWPGLVAIDLKDVGMRTTEGRVCFVSDLGLVATFAM